MKQKVASLIILVTLLFSLSLKANEVILPYNNQLKTLITETFMDDLGIKSDDKIESFKANILKRIEQVEHNISIYKLKKKKDKKKKVAKKLANNGLLDTYRIILRYIEQFENEEDLQKSYELARKILDLNYASKVEGINTRVTKTINHALKNLEKWSISKVNAPEGEASNLIDPNTGLFISQVELKQRKENGEDLSLLDPPAISPFWTKQEIEKLKVEEVYTGGEARLYKGVNLEFPDHKVVTLKEPRKTQSKPKLEVIADLGGEEVEFKLKFASEMHSEITSASLIATLGYNFDPSKYYQNFKMILPKGVKYHDFVKDYEEYFEQDDYPLEKAIKEKGKTKDGKTYVIFHEVLIEKKPEEIKRIGPWAWGQTGHRGYRAARGFLLFNMWVANLDLKEAENNKLALKPLGNGEYSEHFYQHDMGFAFGKNFREKPTAFQWDLVKKVTPKKIKMNFSNFQVNTGFDHVTYSDAKWMARLIARLSRKQITDAVELGGWPKEVSLLLVEKLISRRNQLVSAFELENEFDLMAFDRFITTKNKVLDSGILTQTIFDGYTQDFGNEFYYLMKPFYNGVKNIAALGIQSSFGALDEVEFTVHDNVLGEIGVRADREIFVNPEPTGKDDYYLVEDKVKLKIGIGYGVIVKGMSYYTKEYKIVYPVKSRAEGRFNNGFVFNALLPRDIRQGKLPRKYVLILEDSIEMKAGAEFAPTSSLAGIEVTGGIGLLGRKIIAKTNGEVNIVQDNDAFTNTISEKIFAQLLLIRVPVWFHDQYGGTLNRVVHKIDYNKKNKEEVFAALDQYIVTGDIKVMAPYAKIENLESEYELSVSRFSVLGIITGKSYKRTDDIVIYDEKNPEKKTNKFQIRRGKKSKWAFIGDGEEKEKKLSMFTKKDGDNENFIDPIILLEVNIEDNYTTTHELKNKYMKFIEESVGRDDFFNFDPALHTKNDIWGRSVMKVDYYYNEDAVNTLVNTSEEVYLGILKSNKMWSDTVYNNLTSPSRNSRKAIKIVSTRDKLLFERVAKFISRMKKAKNTMDIKEKYQIVSKAIFKSTVRSNGSYDPSLLKIINEVVGLKDRYVKAIISQAPGHNEMKYPARTPLYNEEGSEMEIEQKYINFDFGNPKWVWKMFN